MNQPIENHRHGPATIGRATFRQSTIRPLAVAALAVALGIGAWIAGPAPAAARIFFGVGFGVPLFPGYYYPYYYPPYPYYYPPPPPPAYSYYSPPYAPGGSPPAVAMAPAPTSAPITYTRRPVFTNAAGQPCREYTATRGSQQVYGTACRDAGGQWRIVN